MGSPAIVLESREGGSAGLQCGVSPDHVIVPNHYAADIEKVWISRGVVVDRIEKLAVDIRKAYGDEELHVLCVLKGSRGFFSELLRVLNRIHRYTDHHVNAPFFEHYVRTAADGSEQVTIVDENKP